MVAAKEANLRLIRGTRSAYLSAFTSEAARVSETSGVGCPRMGTHVWALRSRGTYIESQPGVLKDTLIDVCFSEGSSLEDSVYSSCQVVQRGMNPKAIPVRLVRSRIFLSG